MKNINLLILIFISVSLAVLACNLLDPEETDPEKTLGKPGNYWSVGASGYNNSVITIDENSGGDVVVSFNFAGTKYEVEGKITDQGIYDYVYSNGDKKKPFTLVKFDAEVGDQWEFNVGGKKVVRKVVHKSTEDDYSYAFWMIKTINVEETVPDGTLINGSEAQIKKILWKFNHKFGFIAATVTKSDGTTVEVSQYSTNAAD